MKFKAERSATSRFRCAEFLDRYAANVGGSFIAIMDSRRRVPLFNQNMWG